MGDDYKTLRVPEDDYYEAKEQKEKHNRTWGEQLVCSNDSTTEPENVVDDTTINNLRDELLAKIEALTGDVATVEDIADLADQLNESESDSVVVESVEVQTEQSGISQADVENIVESWMENNYEQLKRGNL